MLHGQCDRDSYRTLQVTSASSLPKHGAADLVVIIPHYDDIVRLRRCLEALVAQDCSRVEIMVSDNATPGGLEEVLKDFPQINCVIEPRKGAAAARNAAMAATSAPWIAFLDADCVPASDWLSRARAIAMLGERTVTGGQVTVFDETAKPRSGAQAFETVFAFDQKTYIMTKGFSVTANLLVSRAAFAAVGPFAGAVSEDVDWCRRATSAGYRLVYDPALRVAHPTRSDWPALARKWRRLTAESFGLHGCGAWARLTWALRAMAMLPSALWHLPRIWWHPDLSVGDRLAGSATLVRLRAARMVWMLGQAWSARRVPRSAEASPSVPVRPDHS